METTTLVASRVPDNTPEDLDGVARADLLALGVGAAGVGDAHLADAVAAPGDLGGQLRVDTETVLPERRGDGRDHFAAEDLRPGLHIGQLQPRERVGRSEERRVGK